MKMPIAATFALLLTTLPVAAQTPSKPPSAAQQLESFLTQGGLQKTEIKGIDLAYMRPGATLAGYRKVMIGPIQIAFVRDFGRGGMGHMRVSSSEMQRIRERLSENLREEATAELAKGGYQVVDAAGEGVLAITMGIANLTITAPDSMATAGSRVYAVSAGEMTLVSEISDSQSGEVIVRAYDREEAPESITPHRISITENRMEARAIAKEWAAILRNQLDLANAKAGGNGTSD